MKPGTALALLALPGILQAQAPAKPAAPTKLDALAWLDGRWLGGSDDEERFEEQWSLRGQSLFGAARTMQKGRTTFIELFCLEADGQDFVMRIRMFGPAQDKIVKGKDEPLRLRLTEADDKHLLCEGIGPEAGTRLLYRLDAPDRLYAEISKNKDGRTSKQSFVFTREK